MPLTRLDLKFPLIYLPFRAIKSCELQSSRLSLFPFREARLYPDPRTAPNTASPHPFLYLTYLLYFLCFAPLLLARHLPLFLCTQTNARNPNPHRYLPRILHMHAVPLPLPFFGKMCRQKT